ncbi:MAG: DEDD exonuclease domain-containing protein [Propionibacteriaceae bacterium]
MAVSRHREVVTASRLQDSFDDLGTALCEVTFCVVDLETTGGAETDHITEIGAVKVRGGVVIGEFQTLIKPASQIPPLIAVLTGITNQMVATAPTLAQALPAYLEFSAHTVTVAHNAPFDFGFLRRACATLDYPWPRPTVLDTVTLARQILLRDEVRDCRLATLARHFHATTTPIHRALADARATVDVLHGLIERVGNLGVHTLEDLQEFSRRVSPARRAKRRWAEDVPESPGVYSFVRQRSAGADDLTDVEVLYVGKSRNLRRRVRSYFTAAEKRARIDEMVRVADGVQTVVCETGLQADVTELRLIAAHAPRYNRRSKFPERHQWLKITEEAFPRLSLVRSVRDDGATYFGPFRRRQTAEDVVMAVYDAFPIRQCTPRLTKAQNSPSCALVQMHRCSGPCDGTVGLDGYGLIVAAVRTALTSDAREACVAVRGRLLRLVASQRYEEAATVRRRLETLLTTARRFHRVSSLAACPEIVAARRRDDGPGPTWEIHVVRYGRLAGAGLARPSDVPQAVARSVVATAETVGPPVGPLPAATIEETEQIADWLERPGVRIMSMTGDWVWPLHAVLTHDDLVATFGVPGPASTASDTTPPGPKGGEATTGPRLAPATSLR